MSDFDLLLMRFLLASLGCFAAGFSVWALSALLRRFLPALAAQRSLWLLGQLAVLATFTLMLLPHSERVRLIPPLEAATETVTHYIAAPKAPALPITTAEEARDAGDSAGSRVWMLHGAQLWLCVYLLGLAWSTATVWRAQRMLNRLAQTGDVASAGDADIIEVDAPISPMLHGLFRPRLLLPRHLVGFDKLQREMIVEHEMTHLRRHDLHWMAAGMLLQTLLWFNPFMRLLRANLTWAQELGCDRDVLRGRPASQRKAYAAALLAQLKLQHLTPQGALAFGSIDANTLTERVSLIRTPANSRRAMWARAATAAALLAIVGGNFALQPALAWSVSPSAQSVAALNCTTFVDAASGKPLLREGDCTARITPVSTFNIAVSLMGFDSGFLKDQHAPLLPYRESYQAWNKQWRRDMDPSQWISYSAVWYAQQVTQHIGRERFERYVQGFGYGNRDIGGDKSKDNGLTWSWVGSSMQISPDEQTTFLRRLVRKELPVSLYAHEQTAQLLKVKDLPNGWQVFGKTGTGAPVGPDGKDDYSRSYGWFVGWATNGQRTIVFARLAQDETLIEGAAGPRTKEAFLRELPAQLAKL
ncbi:class D beta-lactamase [Duganella sp. Root198D2]|uniref:class D beta-lactamase n=1 Tax=Duganella sp. Root198D2 TaxID=1736489 RepID=UPI000AB76253|nr:class D beta-lactamase [Duganella sp. Root198D2]